MGLVHGDIIVMEDRAIAHGSLVGTFFGNKVQSWMYKGRPPRYLPTGNGLFVEELSARSRESEKQFVCVGVWCVRRASVSCRHPSLLGCRVGHLSYSGNREPFEHPFMWAARFGSGADYIRYRWRLRPRLPMYVSMGEVAMRVSVGLVDT